MARVPDWEYDATHWLEVLTDDVSQRVQVSWYEYQTASTSGDTMLQQLLAEGATMLNCLNQWLQASVRRGSHATLRPFFSDHLSLIILVETTPSLFHLPQSWRHYTEKGQ
jgi:hypothetical protein